MSTWTAVLVFAGIPAAIVGLIFAVVVLGGGRRRPHDPDVVVGILRPEAGCAVRIDAGGRHVHETRPGTDPTCFTVRCAECHTTHRDGTDDVHFTDPRDGTDSVLALGWRLAGPRLRCPRCR